MAKLARLIDQKRCMGCRSCIAACATENHFTVDAPWNTMVEYEVGTYPGVKKIYNTMNCMHCEKPSCKAACDHVGAKAISKNAFGVVLIDYDKCIGCGYCAAVCPYGVPQLNKELKPLYPEKGKSGAETIPYADRHPTHRKKAKVAEKCTFCAHKLDKAVADGKVDRIGKDQEYTPACDLVCPTQARLFGDIDDPQSDISKRIKATGAVQLGESYGAPAPYESVSRPGIAAGEGCAAVVRCYADAGFDPPLPGDGPADSLASELRFLALACYRESQAWSAEDRSEAFAWAEVERQFLDDHVLQWVPRHCEAMCLLAETPYFRAVARLIARACIVDREDVAELCAWATLSTDSAA